MPKSTANRLRIGFVLDDGLDKPDGVQQYVLTLGDWLIKQGHYVRYLVGGTKRTDIKEAIPMTRNISVRFNGNSLSTPLPASPTKVRRILKREKFDVLHVQVPHSPFMGARIVAAAPKRTRIIGTFHILPTGKMQYYATRLLGFSLHRNLKKFDKFLSVSGPAKRFAEEAFKINSEVLPNPVDIEKFKRKPARSPGKTVNILFLGRLVPRKGCIHLLEAVDKMLEANGAMDIKVDICGSGYQHDSLLQFINSSRLKGIATMHGFVSEEHKIDFLNRADLAVFPSTSGESFGIVLIEAMAAGAGIVLAGNNPGYASVLASVPDSLFDPADTRGLSEKMYELIKNRTRFQIMHDEQQQLVKKFDIKPIGQKMLDIYTGRS
ncbi:MAG TPA: glycosyltransferase family 4 protein [Candidatus Saccharimonadales bacterium]|nr:glycosyltransferase family 4 protein [Candidatus Saccharimonadales bacterium]